MIIKKIIVNGTFDILHRGHLEMLNYAARLGNYLLVCIDTDRRVKELKGHNRPINNQTDRKFMLQNIKTVDEVRLFDSADELINIIKEYQPDVMVKGSDYKDRPIIGAEYCKEIKFYEYLNGYSTTNTIQNIANW
jgi:D-beta-D-heptose 7-phosphate kinase/D-beta-D-heptose 1-phosphate adenosyltransferase